MCSKVSAGGRPAPGSGASDGVTRALRACRFQSRTDEAVGADSGSDVSTATGGGETVGAVPVPAPSRYNPSGAAVATRATAAL